MGDTEVIKMDKGFASTLMGEDAHEKFISKQHFEYDHRGKVSPLCFLIPKILMHDVAVFIYLIMSLSFSNSISVPHYYLLISFHLVAVMCHVMMFWSMMDCTYIHSPSRLSHLVMI
jgi:hypothetical protein